MLSFTVPAYNEEHELPRALASIRMAAAASGQSFEIIVVDDASNDATAEIARQAGASVVPVHYRQIGGPKRRSKGSARRYFFLRRRRHQHFHSTDWRAGRVEEDARRRSACHHRGATGGALFSSEFSPALYLRSPTFGAGAFLLTTREILRRGWFRRTIFRRRRSLFHAGFGKAGPIRYLRTDCHVGAKLG